MMENEKFQELVLRKLEENELFQKNALKQFESIDKRFEENERFQDLVVKQFQIMSEQMQTLTQGQARLETDLKKIEIRMENEVINKLDGLYLDREVQNERLDKIEQRLTDIEVDTSYLVLRVKSLEKIAK